MPQLIIKIKDKIAKPLNNCVICDNSDYTVKFIFDEEWEKEPLRIARFIWNKQYVDVQFTGDTCEVPIVSKTNNLAIGVYAGDLRTTTPAILACHTSILSEDVVEHSVTPSEYEEIMKLLNAQATDIAALKVVDKRIWTSLDTINKTASAAKVKAEEGVAKADDALTATRTNATNITNLQTDVTSLINEKNIMGSRLTTVETTLNNVKTTAETAETKADNALTAAGTNANKINTLETDVNALKAVDTSLSTRIDNVDSKASTAKTKAEEGVAKADSALARNIFTDEEKAKLANITNPMIIKGRVNTVDDLPTEAEIGWFYFVGLESATAYQEYCYSEKGWEYIGLSQEGVDLSNYYTKAQVDSKDQTLQDALDATNVVVGDLAENLQTAYNKINANTADISELREDINSNIAYGTCLSEATTTKKEVTLYNNPNWKLKNGSIVSVRFTNAVSANSTLSVNGEDAKSIHYKGSAITDNIIKEGDTATFIYNTQFHLIAFDKLFVEGANKLTTDAGSTIKPVYFENGIPKECSYTLGEASSRGVDTEPTNLSDDLITSGAVYEAVTELNEKTDATNTVVGNLSSSLQSAYNSINSIKNEVAINRTTLGYQSKNLLKNNAVTQTVSGVTFTINDDKSITVNGTATAQISFMINNKVGLDVGNYILTGCPSGGSWNTFYLTAYASSAWLTTPDFGSGCNIDNKTVTQVVISIASGYTANNLKFYPMLRYADITDNTYEAYKESVDERLIENKSNTAVNKSTIGYTKKNLLKNTASTKTVSGITFTVNDDKSVTVNGTNSTSNYVNIIVFKGELEAGTYILSGAVSDVFRIRLGLGTSADGYGSYVGIDRGDGYTFTVAEKALYTVTCQVESGKTASNVIFKPMIRDAEITDDTYEPYQPSLVERCLLKDTAGINLGHTQSDSITIDNLASYTALWINVAGAVAGINFQTNLIVPVAYLAKSTSNSVQLAGGIPSSAYITSEGVLAAKYMDGTIAAKVSGNTLDLTISNGTIGSVEVISLM